MPSIAGLKLKYQPQSAESAVQTFGVLPMELNLSELTPRSSPSYIEPSRAPFEWTLC